MGPENDDDGKGDGPENITLAKSPKDQNQDPDIK